MEQKQKNFEQQLQFGIDGEKIVAENFMQQGFFILPVYQFDVNTAPVLFSTNKQYILPDMVVFRNLECAFIEAKRKRQYVKWKGKIETGICQRLYDHYMQIHKNTGLDVFIVFVQEEEEPTGIFYLNLCTPGRKWDGRNHKGEIKEKPLYLWETQYLKQL